MIWLSFTRTTTVFIERRKQCESSHRKKIKIFSEIISTKKTETKQTCSKTRLPPPNEKQQLKQHVLLTQQNADTFRSALNNNHNADNTQYLLRSTIMANATFFAASLNILNSNLMIWLNFNNNDKIIKKCRRRTSVFRYLSVRPIAVCERAFS